MPDQIVAIGGVVVFDEQSGPCAGDKPFGAAQYRKLESFRIDFDEIDPLKVCGLGECVEDDDRRRLGSQYAGKRASPLNPAATENAP